MQQSRTKRTIDMENEKKRLDQLEESTPYYNKPSFLKKMSQAAKQERLAREKKEKETKPVKEESTELQEGRPSQRHPLEGHDYHKKTNVELIGIAKDAHRAAEAMKSHNTTAENKYRDQASDSATVRYFRQKNGMPTWYKKKYGHMKEEVEQIDEVNHRQMANDIEVYAKKSGGIDKNDMMKVASMLKRGDIKGAEKYTMRLDSDPRDFLLSKMRFNEAKDEQLDELSKRTLGSYVKKAAGSVSDKSYSSGEKKLGDPRGMKLDKEVEKRRANIGKAVNRLTREETEHLSELSMKKLTQYKTAATKSSSDADKAGDYEKGNKRFAGIMKATKKQFAPKCVEFKKTMEEDLEHLEEKNVPTSPEKWAQAKAQAKAKFDVYPSAYANGWAAKKYKSMGGGWKSVSEETVNEDLRKWFDKNSPEGGWKRINSKGEAVGPCAREPGEPKPKCMSNEKRASLSKKERASAVKTKRKHDSDPDRKGSPINVSNYGKGKISEQSNEVPFDAPYSTKKTPVKDKSGAVHGPMSVAKHLARMAIKRQSEKKKKVPVKESRLAEIVREAMKDAKLRDMKKSKAGEMNGKNDKFESEPTLTSQIVKT